MNTYLTILIIDDDNKICDSFIQIANSNPKIKILGATNSSETGYIYTRDLSPDAVILDLELYNGNGTGLDYLNRIKNDRTIIKPYILVTSNNLSTTTHIFASEHGADFILSKNASNYSETYVIDFLIMLSDSIKSIKKSNNNALNSIIPSVNSQNNVKAIICKHIDAIGINPKSLGYKYLIEAIFFTINHSSKNIYEHISMLYKKSSASIERAMQYAITSAWQTNDISILAKNYTAIIRSERGTPTILEFIHYYANKILLEL